MSKDINTMIKNFIGLQNKHSNLFFVIVLNIFQKILTDF